MNEAPQGSSAASSARAQKPPTALNTPFASFTHPAWEKEIIFHSLESEVSPLCFSLLVFLSSFTT